MKPSESLFVDIRGLKYHVRSWGRPGAPKLFLVHGWMDVSASFQFVVDALKGDWHVLAPDWRGYGLSQWSGADTYWFHDFIGDLDHLLAHFQHDSPALLVGHSMGGSISSMYAGIRPDRIARLVNIDSMGMTPSTPGDAPAMYAKWLGWLRHHMTVQPYPSLEALAARFRKEHPRLSVERALYMAHHMGRTTATGSVELSCDPRHRDIYSRNLAFKANDMFACWRAVKAPTLLVLADDGSMARKDLNPELIEERRASYRNSRQFVFTDTGHMVHLERPERLAEVVEAFLAKDHAS